MESGVAHLEPVSTVSVGAKQMAEGSGTGEVKRVH